MRIRIVRNAGSYVEGAEFDIDDQVARELIGTGIAEPVHLVRVTTHQTTTDLVTAAAPEVAKEETKTTKRRRSGGRQPAS